jgi:hypothetical protein
LLGYLLFSYFLSLYSSRITLNYCSEAKFGEPSKQIALEKIRITNAASSQKQGNWQSKHGRIT